MAPPGTKEFRLFLDPDLARRLRVEVARREANSTSEVVADLIRQHLNEVEAPVMAGHSAR